MDQRMNGFVISNNAAILDVVYCLLLTIANFYNFIKESSSSINNEDFSDWKNNFCVLVRYVNQNMQICVCHTHAIYNSFHEKFLVSYL